MDDDNEELHYMTDNPFYTWRLLIAHAPGEWVKYGVAELLGYIEKKVNASFDEDEIPYVDWMEALDILIQFAATAEYTPPHVYKPYGEDENPLEEVTVDDVEDSITAFEKLLKDRRDSDDTD